MNTNIDLTNVAAEEVIGWSNLFNQGSVIDPHICVKTFFTHLTPEILGIEHEPTERTTSFKYALAPSYAQRELLGISNKARAIVIRYSLPFGYIRGARFVPNETLPKLIEELEGLKKEFNIAVGNLASSLDYIQLTHLPVVRDAIFKAAMSLEDAESSYMKILSNFPTVAEIWRKSSFSWNLFTIASARSEGVANIASSESEAVSQVIREMIEGLREDLLEKVGAILNGLTKGGKLNIQTVNAAREAAKRVRELNVMNDRVLNEQIRSIESIIDLATSNPNGEIFDFDRTSLLSMVTDVQNELLKSSEQAADEAIKAMTSLGRRKFDVNFNDETGQEEVA